MKTRPFVYAVLTAAFMLLVYYAAAVLRADAEGIAWNTVDAVVLVVLGLAAGAAWGSRPALAKWRTIDAILAANLALVFGLLFVGWSMLWDLAKPLEAAFPGARDLLYGFWFIAGVIAPYIIRKPGAAIAAETLASLAEFLAGGYWGLTLLISGLVQGGMAEVVFAATGYKKYNLTTLMLAGAAAGAGSLVVDYMFWYSNLQVGVLAAMLVARLISGAVLSGWLGKAIADGLYRAGALNSFAIARDEA